ncbi:hypothetical protein EYF80_045837 [Liparis tanakae]|uniref:Uncharacterized protein n=1 Tax=Liparis tanakae TaxID=230148 RepID=A0A4Z2FUF1_9TELE|nr:hypothetical protein EYF80_045837 [Liparis tanakae]
MKSHRVRGAEEQSGFFAEKRSAQKPVLGCWKMGTPTTSICGLILSLVLTCQLVTIVAQGCSDASGLESRFRSAPHTHTRMYSNGAFTKNVI